MFIEVGELRHSCLGNTSYSGSSVDLLFWPSCGSCSSTKLAELGEAGDDSQEETETEPILRVKPRCNYLTKAL